jgi:glycerate dehydrogenase
MKIIVLDGHTLNPGDISWAEVARLGELAVHDRTAAGQVLARADDADILLTNKTPLTGDIIHALPRLRFVSVLATGVNVVDLAAARGRSLERGGPVVVSNVPEYSTDSVAQLVFGLLLELCHRAGRHSDLVHAGEWSRREWCFWDMPLVELAGLTMGIVGFGRIGRRVGAIAHAFGMNVIGHSRRGPASGNTPAYTGFSWGTLEEVFAQADVVSLHVPLTAENRGFVNARLLGLMKKDAYLINTARGSLINDADLAAALREGRIAGAGLDVATVEPINADNPLLAAPHCVMTPHFAWATLAARWRLMRETAANIAAFLAGAPRNVVN